jgi:glycosyltransferase involved in cell wall biosynthesis
MKVLFIKTNIHSKNLNALMKYNIDFCIINHTNLDSIDLSQFDAVYSPSVPINVLKYPNSKFLFGPHFSVFPEKKHMDLIRASNIIYIQPSDWAAKVWRNNSLCNGIRIESLPFGVDTDKFCKIKQINERNQVFIYFKRRQPNELNFIINFLHKNNINYKIFNYVNKYSENDYIQCLQNSKYGIWLDAHESQGFALEEALSCDVPLLVWNVTSMNQEYGSKYNNIPATTIPYWDKRCGEYFYHMNEFENIFNLFITNLETYRPREYILENLSIKKCEENFLDVISKI